jgi:hypothetical protein
MDEAVHDELDCAPIQAINTLPDVGVEVIVTVKLVPLLQTPRPFVLPFP